MTIVDEASVYPAKGEQSEEVNETLTWIADVPLVTNPVVIRAMILVLVISYLMITGIFAIVLNADDHIDRLPTFMLAMLGAFAIVTVLLVLVMLVFFGNRMRVRYFIDDEGMTSVVIDRRAKIASSLAIVAGTASANPGLAGAGLATAGSRREYTKWVRVSEARYYPDRHHIGLIAAGWWPVGSIDCTNESYAVVEKRVREIFEARKNKTSST